MRRDTPNSEPRIASAADGLADDTPSCDGYALPVTRLREFCRSHALLASLLLACMVMVRGALPGGYMPVSANGHIVLALCNGAGGKDQTVTIGLKQAPDDAEDSLCKFALLSAPVLGGGEPPTMAAPALPYTEYALPPPAPLVPARPAFLTPPLRGPPAAA